MKEVGAFPAVLIKLSISWESGLDGVKSHLQEKREGGKKILAVQYGLTNHLGSYKRQIEQQISGLWNLDNLLEKTKIKSNNCEIRFSSFSFFFHPGPFYCCSRQQGIVLLLEAKCSFWEHFAKSNRTRHDTLEANRDTSPPEGPTVVTVPAGHGAAPGTDLVSRCGYRSCEQRPSPYLYRLLRFQRTKMATSLHKINGVLFMGFKLQLGAWFSLEGTVNTITRRVLHCKFSVVFFVFSFRRALEIR